MIDKTIYLSPHAVSFNDVTKRRSKNTEPMDTSVRTVVIMGSRVELQIRAGEAPLGHGRAPRAIYANASLSPTQIDELVAQLIEARAYITTGESK